MPGLELGLPTRFAESLMPAFARSIDAFFLDRFRIVEVPLALRQQENVFVVNRWPRDTFLQGKEPSRRMSDRGSGATNS